jgi:HK97 family phage portal protein
MMKAMLPDRAKWMQARFIPTWQAGRPLPAADDYDAFVKEGYLGNPLVASCIWEIATSASEPDLVVKRRLKDGTKEIAQGPDADMLRTLLAFPNPEQTNTDFLEQLFTWQQITGNWFFRKLRAEVGKGVVQLWPLEPPRVKIIAAPNGWVRAYTYDGLRDAIDAGDVVHDKLRPNPDDMFWGLGPIGVLRRPIDLDNQAAEYLRVFFQNNATPGGLLKLKARMEPAERVRLKELWTKEHSGTAGWHSISVLDADGEYQEIGASPDKLRLQAIFDQTESRICMAFGVPPILVGATIGLNRSTFANYEEARRSFWEETLKPLYKKCAERLTQGVAYEFNQDLCIEFDLSKIEALNEAANDKRQFAFDAYDRGFITLDAACELAGLPPVGGEEGSKRKVPGFASDSGLASLLGDVQRRSGHEQHKRTPSAVEKKALARLNATLKTHFQKQGKALAVHLEG